MLIPGLMVIFSLIIFYIGNYLYRHQHRDFMLFKPTSNSLLSSSLRVIGILLMIVSLLTLIAGISSSTNCGRVGTWNCVNHGHAAIFIKIFIANSFLFSNF